MPGEKYIKLDENSNECILMDSVKLIKDTGSSIKRNL
jgi:hypothetical protein